MKKKIVATVSMTLVGLLLTMVSPSAASPYFAIGGDQWQDGLDGTYAEGTVEGVTTGEWSSFFAVWQSPDEGAPYPASTFYDPNLSVYPGTDSFSRADLNSDGIVNGADFAFIAGNWLSDGHGLAPYSYPEEAGLVMFWGPTDQSPGESTSSAWKFKYGEDPDLTNCTISVQANPSDNINVLSLGLKDINGKIKAWYWQCGPSGSGEPLVSKIKNQIIIAPDNFGITATDPNASSFVEESGFDITQVISLIADENNSWQSDQAVPPPGETIPAAWNYWYNLSVTAAPGSP